VKKNIAGFIFMALAALVIVSCSKEEKNELQTQSAAQTVASAADAKTVYTSCGSIPADLNVPEGNKLLLQAYATGVQIYQVRRNPVDPNVFEWVNVAPAATLYAKPDFTNLLGTHYKGPSWEFTKGVFKDEKVVAAKQKGVNVDATAVPWLLLKAVDSLSSPGNKVTYIQRVCTTGGLPPATIPSESNLGKLDSIPYTANYLCYIKD
jgi:hypothetical protein